MEEWNAWRTARLAPSRCVLRVCALLVLLLPLLSEGSSQEGASHTSAHAQPGPDGAAYSQPQWCRRPHPPAGPPGVRDAGRAVLPKLRVPAVSLQRQRTAAAQPALPQPARAVSPVPARAYAQPVPPTGSPRPGCRGGEPRDQEKHPAAAPGAPGMSEAAVEAGPTAHDGSAERPAKRALLVIPSPDEFVKEQRDPVPVVDASAANSAGLAQGPVAAGTPAAGSKDTAHAIAQPDAPLGADARAASDASSADTGDTDKRRINLAAAADGASIVASNKEARKPEKTIDSDDDSYMKNSCAANKWLIIELSQLGRVDEVELVNKEMYSSRVKDFSVRGRQSHPRKDGPPADYPRWFASEQWQLLGNMTAANKKGAQIFRLPFPARVRYVLFQFHTHYGSEDMCALNSISVLGVSAAQELEEALAAQLDSGPTHVTQAQQPGPTAGSGKLPQVPAAGHAAPAEQPQPASSHSSGISQPPHPTAPSLPKPAVVRQHPTCATAERLVSPGLLRTCDLPPRPPRHAAHPPGSSTDMVIESDEYSDEGDEVDIGTYTDSSVDSVGADTKERPVVVTGPASAAGTVNVSQGAGNASQSHVAGAVAGTGAAATAPQAHIPPPHTAAQTQSVPEPPGRPPVSPSTSTSTQGQGQSAHTVPEAHKAPITTPGAQGQGAATGQPVPPVPEPVLKVSIPAEPALPAPTLSTSATTNVNTGTGHTLPSRPPPPRPPAQGGPKTVPSRPPVVTESPTGPVPHTAGATGVPAGHVSAGGVPTGSGPAGVPTNALPESDAAVRRVYVLPPPETPPPSQLDSLLHAVEGGSAAKPKQTGNLFDVFKQEFVLLRLNQTRTWQYIAGLVEVLNRNAAEAGQELDTLEKALTALETRVNALPAMVEAGVSRRVAHKYDQQINRLLVSVQALQEQVAVSRQREWAMLLYCSAVLAIVLAVTLTQNTRQGQGSAGSRTFVRLVCVLGIFNGLIGVTLQSQRLQRVLAVFLGMQMS